jgi:hypothetical protein
MCFRELDPGFSPPMSEEKHMHATVNRFDSREHDDESARAASRWIRDERLEGILPNLPKITFGQVIVQKTGG